MVTATAQDTNEEVAKIGQELYERKIKPLIPAGNEERVVALDINSGEFELADDALTSAERLHARVPGAVVYVVRVGYSYLHRIRFKRRTISS
jgi:hypothetical protein